VRRLCDTEKFEVSSENGDSDSKKLKEGYELVW
jgi:hypothetical protein